MKPQIHPMLVWALLLGACGDDNPGAPRGDAGGQQTDHSPPAPADAGGGPGDAAGIGDAASPIDAGTTGRTAPDAAAEDATDASGQTGPDAATDSTTPPDSSTDSGLDEEDSGAADLERGQACDPADDRCAGELVCQPGNRRCCAPGEHCCQTPDHCPDGYRDERGCVEAESCWGSVETATCEDHTCGSVFLASATDPSGCLDALCEAASCSGAVATPQKRCDALGECLGAAPSACADNLGCAVDACATSCQDGTSDGCAEGFVCQGGDSCVPTANPGADCSQSAGGPSVCDDSLVCNEANERCCAAGQVCCEQVDDCPDQVGDEVLEGPVCSDPLVCEGQQRTKACQDNVCGFTATALDAQCDALTCDGGICGGGVCSPQRIGQPCSEDAQCLSRECEQPAPGAPGVCRGAAGEACVPGGPPCVANGICWWGDAQGATFRCFPPACVGQTCSYWDGDEQEGWCDGQVQDFTTLAAGMPLGACYDAGTGLARHEAACFNAFDDDADSLTDSDDPDCQPGTGDFWLTATGRGTRALCSHGLCGGSNATQTPQCQSGVGGCFDAACHLDICWPSAGSCQGLAVEQTLCKWWDSIVDLDDSCEAAELLDRPDGSQCGPGCSCESGLGTEWLCADERDNDLDGLLDADDPDCQRQHGDACVMGRFNGAPDPGDQDRLISGFLGGADQCAGDAVCWCADADCGRGVCLNDTADCVTSGSFACNYYTSPDATDCGPPMPRTDGDAALSPAPGLGHCQGGDLAPLGSGTAGEPCDNWYDCQSGYCLCADATCGTRACWDQGDCGGNLCFARVDGTTCTALDLSAGAIACGGGSVLHLDLSATCTCGNGGVMSEIACDDGITNDWPMYLGENFDVSADWMDVDCYLGLDGNALSPWQATMGARFAD